MSEIKRSLHEVIDIIDTMCEMQVNGIDSSIPFLRGAPGAGKTESIRTLALSKGDEFLSCHFALKQPEDLGGIPQFSTIVHDGKEILSTNWSIPEILEELLILSNKAKENNKKVIFFLDDIHRCGPFHVTALFELLSERKIREINLPSNVAIVLAGNGSIKAGAQLTNSAIINRCSVMDIYTDFNYWKTNFALKNNFNIHILSFLENRKYNMYFHEEEDIESPWGSPRSWTKLSNLINILMQKGKITTDKLEYVCQAHVGNKAAKDFVAYYQIITKFKVDQLFDEIGKQVKDKSLQDAINFTIEKIQKEKGEGNDLYQYALAHASLIEFLQKTSKERKEKKYIVNLCVLLLAFQMNPENTFPEMTISILKELQVLLREEKKDFREITTTYDKLAESVNQRKISEMLDDILSNN